ncbi:MAG: ABC transporter substrate-binding protein [Candidatus Rokubacteria bacterium]|nr:ABC transporter substrate-binding protein [Candidatus Rokubacteria bacterium]
MRSSFALVCAIVLVASVAGSMGHPASAEGAEPIKVLGLDVLSGPFKDIGERYLLGVKFAVEEINGSGGINGRPIKLYLDDSQLKPDVAQRKAIKYILDDGVKIIMGFTGTHVAKAVAQVAAKHKVIVVQYSAEADELTGKDHVPYVFRLALTTSMHAAATTAAFADKPHKKFYLLNQDYAYGHDVAKAYKKSLDRLKPGWQLAGEEYHPLATKDFAPYIQKIIAAGPDAVLTGNWGSDLSVLVKQAGKFGVKVPFGHQFLSDPVAMREIGEAAIGHFTSEVYMLGVDTPPNREFIERWHRKFKDTENPWPEFTIGKAYNTTMFMAAALKKANSDDADAVIRAWEGMAYESLIGRQVMRACDHQVQTPVAVAEIVPGPGKFYPFPFTGRVTLVPAENVSVPPKETGNKRCE